MHFSDGLTDAEKLTYGASTHYTEHGQKYFEFQRRPGRTYRAGVEIPGQMTAPFFQGFVKPTDTVVDFGAGGGGLLAALTAEKKLAVEINPHARAFCVTQFQIEAVPASTFVSTAFADVVISNHCLEHVPYPIAAIREIHRILKPQGLFLLCLPLDDWRTQRIYSPSDINHHLHTWTPMLLGHTLAEGGFTNPKIQIITDAWPPGAHWIYQHLHSSIFRLCCWLFAAAVKRRQLIAVSRKSV